MEQSLVNTSMRPVTSVQTKFVRSNRQRRYPDFTRGFSSRPSATIPSVHRPEITRKPGGRTILGELSLWVETTPRPNDRSGERSPHRVRKCGPSNLRNERARRIQCRLRCSSGCRIVRRVITNCRWERSNCFSSPRMDCFRRS